jgi:hypothetical protein
MTEPYNDEPEARSLPLIVEVDEAFSTRLPSQRVLDEILKVEPGGFAAVAETQAFRVVAFRALLRDFPDYDPTALWLHAYDVEVEVRQPDPTNGKSPTHESDSVTSGT